MSHVRSRSTNGGPTIHMVKTTGIRLSRPEEIQQTNKHVDKAAIFLPGVLRICRTLREIVEVTNLNRNGGAGYRNILSEFPVCSMATRAMSSFVESRIPILRSYALRG